MTRTSTFTRLDPPTRSKVSGGRALFDLTPDDDQQMLVEVTREIATNELRPAALKADEACAPPQAILDQGNELGLALLGVPEDLGGTATERSAVTSVLVTEQLARGDMGLAVALLGTSAVSTASPATLTLLTVRVVSLCTRIGVVSTVRRTIATVWG